MPESIRFIAYYLPQFHPIPENDKWWGAGFTEWANVAKAKPLFRGHYQPHLPADLGFYDLRLPEVRVAQALMASEFGIEGFCYWHYWFAGRRLLERPFNEVLESKDTQLPFCLGWANESWTGIWHGAPNRILMEQTYPGMGDHQDHFQFLIRAFTDDRYIKVDGKPVFVIYRPRLLPDANRVLDYWRELARVEGLKGLYLVGTELNADSTLDEFGFDAVTPSNLYLGITRNPLETAYSKYLHKRYIFGLRRRLWKKPINVFPYSNLSPLQSNVRSPGCDSLPCIVPNWDNTPRSGRDGFVLHGSTPELFKLQVRKAIEQVAHLPSEHRIVFVKSWNEWAEGNHLEPDWKYGKAYLQVIKDEQATMMTRGEERG